MLHNAKIGSISTATLRPIDLLDAFASEIEWIGDEENEALLVRAHTILNMADTPDLTSDDEISSTVEDLTMALEAAAPPFCYFGTLEGDGADFGFWPCMEEIEELPRVSDPSEVEDHLGEECAFVNDHGSVTVYSAAGKVILELV